MQNTHHSKRPWFVSLWFVSGSLAFSCFLLVMLIGILSSTRREPGPIRAATAILLVSPAVETFTPQPSSTPVITATEVFDPSLPVSADISIGAFVQIVGTAGTGLRLRSEPGLNGDVLLFGVDSEVFRVDDGPVNMDDYTWWYLVGPFDNTRQGWAVSDYLSVVQNP
jgi:hypothetical protein